MREQEARRWRIEHLVQTGPLILAAPIAAAAGALTFLSPCVLPLVPGYLSYVTGMSGTDAQRAEAATTERVAVTPGGTSVPADAAASGTPAARARPAPRERQPLARPQRGPAGSQELPGDGPCSAPCCS